jgi:hypothetical protein
MKKMSDAKTKSVKGGATVAKKPAASTTSAAKQEKIIKKSLLSIINQASGMLDALEQNSVKKDELKKRTK